MIYEIINPSDAYSLETDDAEAAAFAVVLLGGGKYGLKPYDEAGIGEKRAAPILLFSKDPDAELNAWWVENFGHGAEAFSSQPESRDRIAAVLESVLIVDPADRQRMQKVFAAISSDDERRKAMDIYHDEKRGSMNDIGSRAKKLAAKLRSAGDRNRTPEYQA